MKKLLLATVAAAALASPALAGKNQLPSEMLGSWCTERNWEPPGAWFRDLPGCRYSFTVGKTYYRQISKGWKRFCSITKITPENKGYIVMARCKEAAERMMRHQQINVTFILIRMGIFTMIE
jgi:hypothetical protein